MQPRQRVTPQTRAVSLQATARIEPKTPVSVGDLHATVLTAVGISPGKLSQTPIGRTVKFAEGQPIAGLLG